VTTVTVLGLGEAGSHYAAGLLTAGAVVCGYDPRVQAVDGVVSMADAAHACRGAQMILSLNSSADALAALTQGLPGCAPGALWAEMNTAAPAVKQAVAEAAGGRVRVVDVAVMAPVPPRGLFTPLTASGPHARAFADMMDTFGVRVVIVDGPVGAAATHKLLRSVFYKGLAAAVTEALAAAREVGLEDWLRANITEELVRADASTVERLVTGSRTHAIRAHSRQVRRRSSRLRPPPGGRPVLVRESNRTSGRACATRGPSRVPQPSAVPGCGDRSRGIPRWRWPRPRPPARSRRHPSPRAG
jgi:3-hydroxyisobutyrate dehydrogenase-like beta-hydroxyacid dehydrogenase